MRIKKLFIVLILISLVLLPLTPVMAEQHAVIEVDISDFAFSPAAITVPVGATVTWTNRDTVVHTVTSGTGLFDSGDLLPDATFSYTFTEGGTFSYLCTSHPVMIGSITVTDQDITLIDADSRLVSNIADQLICQCGCTLVLATCTCAIAAGMVALIEQKLAQGQSEEEVIQFFVAQYGEQVLASPPKQGFNLVLWVLVPVGILVGGGVVYIVLKKWVRRGRQPPSTTETEEEDEEYRKRLEKELEEFSEGGFR